MLARLVLAALVAMLALAGNAHARPNFVFVLADDLSSDLVTYMPRVQAMMDEGTSFDRYVVTNSLCCPSRASILTGRYSHSTGIFRNQPPDGGFEVFRRAEQKSTFATSLQAAGYRTALMGKYMNGYAPGSGLVPAGWSAWAVSGNNYRNFDYSLLVKEPGPEPPLLVRHGSGARDYLTDVISRRGRRFIAEAVRDGVPFMLELAPYAPHHPFTAAPRDRFRFPDVQAPRTPLFNVPQPEGGPDWLPEEPMLWWDLAQIDRDYRKRVRAVQSIDRMIGAIRTLLTRLGAADDTYVVFSSDNGFHLGERALRAGKQGAWDHDIRVPLVVAGPGVPAGATVGRLAANVDLRPTFEELAGVPTPPRVEGRSLAGLLLGRPVDRWRAVTLVEHHGPPAAASDPDAQDRLAGRPPSYSALRFRDALYVAYDNPKRPPEYYDHATDPFEQRNVYPSLPPERQAELAALLERMRTCHGGASCQAADLGA